MPRPWRANFFGPTGGGLGAITLTVFNASNSVSAGSFFTVQSGVDKPSFQLYTTDYYPAGTYYIRGKKTETNGLYVIWDQILIECPA